MPYYQKKNAKTLIVFVHGILSDSQHAWTSDKGFFWPEYLAEKDENFTNVSVLSFGYDSDCGPNLNIREIAASLKTKLQDIARKQHYERLEFIAHSMGGLVVREFILSELKDIAPSVSVHKVILLSTPNFGSSYANLLNALCKNPQFENIRDGENGYLEQLNSRWRSEIARPRQRTFDVAAAYELLPTKGLVIVDRNSAREFAQVDQAFKRDHFSIAKPRGEDELYVWVRNQLLETSPAVEARLTPEQEDQITKTGYEIEKSPDISAEIKALLLQGDLKGAHAAVDRVESAHKGEALRLAQLHFTRAKIFEMDFKFSDALSHYRQALQLAPENAAYVGSIASLEAVTGHYKNSEFILKEALARTNSSYSPMEKILLKNMLAAIYQTTGRNTLARALLESEIKDYSHHGIAFDPIILANILINLANMDNAEEKFSGADVHLSRAVDILRNCLVCKTQNERAVEDALLTALHNRAKLFFRQGRYNEAEALFQEVLSKGKNTSGPGDPGTATTLNDLGLVHVEMGELSEGLKEIYAALEMRTKLFGPDHRDVARSKIALASAYLKSPGFYEAKPYLDDALRIMEQTGPGNPEIIQVLSLLKTYHMKVGQYGEADRLQKKIIENQERARVINWPITQDSERP